MVRQLIIAFASALIIGSAISLDSQAQQSTLPSWTQPQGWRQLTPEQRQWALESNLTGRVKTYLDSRGYQLGAGAENEFRKAIARVAQEIEFLPEQDQRAKIEEATRNFQTLIDMMIIRSRSIPGYPPGKIGEQTLFEAMKMLCPLWPFCDTRM